jgi:polyhydroxyalkanoate synthase subunit PhaC
VDRLSLGDLRVDLIEEADELLMPMTFHFAADDGAIENVERGEQIGRVVALVNREALVDFTEVGDIAVFIDEEQLASLERRMRERGYLEAQDMATTFNMLRANDLIWSFVVSNYLLGREQMPVDLFFWNSDSTRMPASMHSFYLRKMYHENRLAKPGGITLAGTPIDLSKIRTPSFILATREDSPTLRLIKGSWWPLWDEWITLLDEGRVPAREPGSGKLPIIENAPGSYVRVRYP